MAPSSRPAPSLGAGLPLALVVFSGFLLLAAIALLLPGQASAQTNPPVSGDWIIADTTAVASQTVTVNGNVVVENGGSLSLNAVALRIGSTYPGEFALYVKAGGTLAVSGGSIGPVSTTESYRFEIHGWATLDNVQPITGMWGSRTLDKFGIQIYNGNVSITNSTITSGERGNILVSAGKPLIANNIITSARYVEIANQTQCPAYQAYVTFTAIGILVTNNSAPTIRENQIRDNGAASSFVDPWQQFYEQNYLSCPSGWGYYYIYEFILGYGLSVSGASPEIINNSIFQNTGIPTTSTSRTVNGTQIVSQRYAESWLTNEFGAGLRITGGGKGNITGNLIDRNSGAGVFADGSQSFFEYNTVTNHSSGPGIVVGGGLKAANLTVRNNVYGVSLNGGGVADFDRIDFGSSTNAMAVYADSQATGVLNLYNSSLANWTSPNTVYYQSYQGAAISLFNCTIDPTLIDGYGVGQVNIFWSLRMQVQWPNGAPAGAAFAILTNQSDGVIYADRVDDAGMSPDIWIAGLRKIFNWGNPIDETSNGELSVKIYANGTISDPFDFRFNSTTFLVITITDPIPPSLNVFFPTSGAGFTTSSFRATGNAFDVGSGMERVAASIDGGQTWINSSEPLPGWGIDITLPDGVHDILVRAFDFSGTFTEIAVAGLRVDTVAPELVILQPSLPTSGALISYTTFTAVVLRGTVADDTLLTLNGDALSVQGGTFSRQLILAEGPNYFVLHAVDGVGNSDEVSFILVSDITAPALFVSSPVDNFATNRSLITVAGVTETEILLTLNDRIIHTSGGVFSEPFALSEGPNTVRITATDRAGNNNTITRTVIFDTVAPDITLTSPTPNMLTRFSDLTVQGSVEAAILTVYVNGAPVPTVRGLFHKEVRLDEGNNVIVVSAWDPAGNPSTTSAVVTVDSTPPEVAITGPVEGALVNSVTVVVRGTFANASAVRVNGVSVLSDLLGSSASGEFEESVALVEGRNLIEVEVEDAAGNAVSASISVERDTGAPVLTLDLPPSGLRTQANVVTITGRTTGAVALRANGQLVAFADDGAFSVTLPLEMNENRITFVALDLAGNEATVLGTVNRDPIPVAPQGLFGLGDLQYVLLPLFLIVGVAATFLVLRRRPDGTA